MRSGRLAHARPPDSSRLRDSSPDLLDVPAAVVCAACGDPMCAGCGFDEPTHPSGIVAIIPWERPGLAVLPRMWHTSKLATTQAASFFGALPDGEIAPALAFALVTETFAVGGLLLCVGAGALLALPELLGLLRADPALLATILRGGCACLVGLVLLMVGIHAGHGVALDLAADPKAARKRSRGVRFGLYACGWDLITLPPGLLTVALLDGRKAAARAFPLGLTAPMHAAEGYLVGVRGVPVEQARKVARRATALTGLAATLLLSVLTLLAFLLKR
jgi:hypothetical protein